MKTLTIINPATGASIGELAVDEPAAIAAKAQAARLAQPAWAAVPLAERLAVIGRFRAAVVAELETLATTLTQEVGKPIAQSRNELNGLLGRLDFFLAETGRSLADETVFEDPGLSEQITHEPLGVVASLSAWNYPWFVGCNVLVPALAAGNAVLYKPSEYATLSGQHIVRLLHAAGVPAAVLACVTGGGDTGAALLEQRLDGVFFTGSHATGQRIAKQVAGRLIRLQLELGGKDPTYVRADADPRTAAESLADGAFYNTGQSCCSVERIYVHHELHDAFVEHFLASVSAMKRGDPMHDDTYIGAITRPAQLDVLQAQIADALALGASLRAGGQRLPGPGNWFAPTVLTGVDHRMTLMREESFGPVIGIQSVSGDEEALALMNDTRYGLTAGVYTRDESAARAILSRVAAGSVYWNCCDRVSPRLPWSGVGDSGVGVTLSVHGIRAMTRMKAWHLRQP
jgi:acyl-CoA reductase-like NAD-dependent aldehyde dehydrogenase